MENETASFARKSPNDLVRPTALSTGGVFKDVAACGLVMKRPAMNKLWRVTDDANFKTIGGRMVSLGA